MIDAINEVLDSRVRARWGFWMCYDWLRNKKRGINHKRLYRVYKAMGLNHKRRTKKRVPARVRQPLAAPAQVDCQWSMDFMQDSLYCGRSFRTLNLFDEGTREALAIEVDTSLPTARVIRVLEQLKDSRQLPTQIRVDNGPEFDSAKLHAWCDIHHIKLHFIQPGRPMQNGYVEGSGFITIRKTSDNSVVESFDVATSPRLGFAGATLTIDPTSDFDPATSYYVTIDPTGIEDLSGNAFAGLAGNAAWNFTSIDGTSSPISVVNDGSFGGSAPGATVTQSIMAGAGADMLVVMIACELGGLSGDPMTVTYGGVDMQLAVGNLTNSAIWYLDLATPGISGNSVIVDMSGYDTRNGFAAGWVTIDGNLATGQLIAVHSTGTSAAQSNTVDLTTTAQTFNVVNFNGNNKSGTITVNSPNPTVIYTDNDIGSARSAAAYVEAVEAGTSTYQWTLTNGTLPADYRRIDAAAFAVVSAGGGNKFSDWIALYPGVGTMTGFNQDPDGDGVDSGTENFFGTDPSKFSQGLVSGAASGNTFSFTHPLSDTPASDLMTTYRWSTDLMTFHGDGEINPAGTQVDFSIQNDTPSPGITTVTASVTGTPVGRLFVTVEATSGNGP